MKTTVKITLTEKDLKEVLCKTFGFVLETADLKIHTTKGDRPFDADHTEIIFEGQRKESEPSSS